METKNNDRIIPALVATAFGIFAGFAVNKFVFKRQDSSGATLMDKLKAYERRVYSDGMKRAKDIEEIKNEVNNKITEQNRP